MNLVALKSRTRAGKRRNDCGWYGECGDGFHVKGGRTTYVQVGNAPGLNMTRAFGNFGLKSIDSRGECNDELSAVAIDAHLSSRSTREVAFMVIGSDGLWDNLSRDEVGRLAAAAHETWITSSSGASGSGSNGGGSSGGSTDADPHATAAACAGANVVKETDVASMLVQKAKEAHKKTDDITCVVAFFKHAPVMHEEPPHEAQEQQQHSGDLATEHFAAAAGATHTHRLAVAASACIAPHRK